MSSSQSRNLAKTFEEVIDGKISETTRRQQELRKEALECPDNIKALFVAADQAKDSNIISGWLAKARLNNRISRCSKVDTEISENEELLEFQNEAKYEFASLLSNEWTASYTSEPICNLMHQHYLRATGKSARINFSRGFFINGVCKIYTPEGSEEMNKHTDP